MNLEGKIKSIGETQTFGSNGFKKRELVLTTTEQYPQHILIEFVQDKCEILDKYNVNDPVKIDINLRGREWVNSKGETKYFNSIQGWRIERTDDHKFESVKAAAAMVDEKFPPGDNDDDLPW